MKVELYHTTEELKRLFRSEKKPRLAARIRAVYLAMMDKTEPEIAIILGYTRGTIQNWIYAYNRLDYEALRVAVINAWQKTCLDKIKIKSICRAKYVESEFI